MSRFEVPVQRYGLEFDEESYDRVNNSTLDAYDACLEVIADEDPDKAFQLLHTVLDRYPDIAPVGISVHTSNWQTSIDEDGYNLARGVFLAEAEAGFLGSSFIQPAEVVVSVIRQRRARTHMMSRGAWNHLAGPRMAFTISIDPPSFAM